MAVSDEYLAYVIEQLTPLAPVTSRRMFGGVGLYAHGFFFGLIGNGVLYFKVDDSNRADYERLGSKPFCPFPDKSDFSMSYYNVPEDFLDDSEELCRWARKSVAVALASVNKKSRPKRKAVKKKSPAKRSVRKKSK